MFRLARYSALWLGAVALCWGGADAQRFVRDVKTLAAPEMKGRGDGSPELERAARYIADQFKAAGLEPLDGKSYFQPFSVSVGAKLKADNEFQFHSAGRSTSLRIGQDFSPFTFSSSKALSGAVVFAGYGITAPEYHYDDYAGLDVKDKIVLVLRHEPQENDAKSVFAGKDYTRHASFINKAINARNRGASALIVVNDRAAHASEEDRLVKFNFGEGPEDAGLPVIHLKAAIADQWLAMAGKSLAALQKEIDKTLEPQSFALPDSLQVSIRVDIEREHATVNNVAAYLPGPSDEYVIIGAHYDHLGLGYYDSLAPSMAGTVHPGADDNASGTAGLMELARMFAARKSELRRGVVFLAFSGEELGLLGSNYYVNHSLKPLEKAVAMINLDMIGRMRNDKIFVGGVGTGTSFKPLLEAEAKEFAIHVDYSAGGYDSSDHTSFNAKQVPVLFFFSGLHSDYHKPSDTWDKVEGPQTARLLDMVFAVAEGIDEASARPEYVRVMDSNPHSGSTASGSSGGGYGPYFGSIPDFGQVESGVKFADVKEGSPAGKAGLKAGDVLVEFDGKPIKNLYDFTYALRSRNVGDTVEVEVVRDGKLLRMPVTLEQRR